jgi:SAM-dependent methyltransferase
MNADKDPIIAAYSRNANEYAGRDNAESCWGRLSTSLWAELEINHAHRLVVDVGCGSGGTLAHLATSYPQSTRLLGVEPADNMRVVGGGLTERYPNIAFCNGRFEALPLESHSVDYLYSIMAFHWVAQPEQGVSEIHRVLRPAAAADIFFVGRWNGREFISKTTPIFLKHMGAAQLFASARLRRQLTAEEAADLFTRGLPERSIQVREIYETYYDTLEGHWRWWVRIEGQLASMEQPKRAHCEEEVRLALQQMEGPQGIPYTVHVLHARIAGSKGT